MEVKRTERGWAGHFCMGNKCHFRRNTLLEKGETRIVVSTVGATWDERTESFLEIGYKRHFETMVFVAQFRDPYWDSDIAHQINFDSPWTIYNVEYNSDFKANEMHERVVEEITQKLQNGEINESTM